MQHPKPFVLIKSLFPGFVKSSWNLVCEIVTAVAKKYQDSGREVNKKGLPATPYRTLSWPAIRKEESTVCEIYR
jgi:hypothetical protein